MLDNFYGMPENTWYRLSSSASGRRGSSGKETALSGPQNNGAADETERLKRLIGELTVANDTFKKRWKEGKDDSSTDNAKRRDEHQKVAVPCRLF